MAHTVVIGAGALGLSIAWHLARRGEDVEVFERNVIGSGTSWHAAGIVGPLRATANMTRLAMQALATFPELEAETGMSVGFRTTGGMWLARSPDRMDELQRIASLGRVMGLSPEVVDPAGIASRAPYVDNSGLVGALAVAEDATVDPVGLCAAYARAARGSGARIHEASPVLEVLVENGAARGVRLGSGRTVRADRVVIAAGAWSKPLAERAGVPLPLQPVEHMYVVTEPVPGVPDPCPVLRDLDAGIYLKGDAGGRLVIGGFERDAKCWNAFGPEGDRPFLELAEDWEQFAPFMEAALNLVPALAETGIRRFMNGPESFAADTRPLLGLAPEVDGLFIAAGGNSVGVMSSAGIGKVMADWIMEGAPPFDLWEVDVARADVRAADPAHLRARMAEAVADLFAMHWPYRQPEAGRGLRRSALHDRWASVGAVFGLAGGWERALWYARQDSERELPYSTGEQPWQEIVHREAAAMGEGAAMIDLSPFSKFDVEGPEAAAVLQELAAGLPDGAIGQAIYTPLLNRKGGIEADVTITRTARDAFRITSGAATRRRDLALLRRAVAGRDATLRDVTEQEVVIGVMGAASRAIMSALSDDDWDRFPFATSRLVTVAGVRLRATRISFVGELGWELYIPAAEGGVVFDALCDQGARPMGHHAVEGCRIEKGFRHWGHDIGPDLTPLEAGLGFTIDWQGNCHALDALAALRDRGIRRRLQLFELPDRPLVLHDEPIFEKGRAVGMTTSGARGARSRLGLAFGLITVEPGETPAHTAGRQFEIEIAGKRYPARALARPPFDPEGRRMRA